MRSFDQAINRAFLIMQQGDSVRTALETNEEYWKTADELYKAIRTLVPDRKKAKEITRLATALKDMEALYFYRLGIQHGVHITSEGFAACLEMPSQEQEEET